MLHKQSAFKFCLNNFEGTLDSLFSLIQKNEIAVKDLFFHQLAIQFLKYLDEAENSLLNDGAEFVATFSWFLWLKSKSLLPKPVLAIEEIDSEEASLHNLEEYSRFKEIAKELSLRHVQQIAFHTRGLFSYEPKKALGIEHLGLDELATLFQALLSKVPNEKKEIIQKELWQISDKIGFIRKLASQAPYLRFMQIFTSFPCREEIIVTFLAILELLKLGEINVVRDTDTRSILIIPTEAT